MKKIFKPFLINPDILLSVILFLPLYHLGLPFWSLLVCYTLLVTVTGPLTFYLVRWLENMYPVLLSPGEKYPVLVLGGGYTPDSNLPINQQITLGSLGRLIEGIRLLNNLGSGILVLSGPCLLEGWKTLASLEEDLAVNLCQLNPDNIVKLPEPTTTEGEALAYLNRFGRISPYLVTKAIHMPRAVLTFQSLGIKVVPAPCNVIFKEEKLSMKHLLIPSFSYVTYLGELLKELWGIVFIIYQGSYVRRLKPQAA